MSSELSPIGRVLISGVLTAAEIFSGAGAVSAASFTPITREGNDRYSQTASADCKYEDNPTPHTDYSDWQLTLVNTSVMVGKEYKPPDLVFVRSAGIAGSGMVRSFMIDDLRALAAAAKKNNTPIAVQSAFRSYSTQIASFNKNVSRLGYARALTYSARPGHSEHQLGTTIDFKTPDGTQPWKYPDWGKTPAGKWMQEHAWEYGFVLSYPKGERDTTCYRPESWHYRYFGRDQAEQMHDSGLTTTEYLENLNATPRGRN